MRCTPLKEHTVEISLFGLFLQVYTLRSGRDNTVCASKSKLTLHVQYVSAHVEQQPENKDQNYM